MLDEPDQQAVIRGLRNGRPDAWNALYDAYSVDVWRYVARLIGPSSVDVADVVQETFLAAARSARQFDAARGSLWGWLTGIAHHQTSSYWRQISRTARLQELAASGAGELRRWIDGSHEELDFYERGELRDVVRATLASLPADYAAVLTAKYLDDQSLEEISKLHGGSVDATKSKLARARREFRTKFDRLMHDPASPREKDNPVNNPSSDSHEPAMPAGN